MNELGHYSKNFKIVYNDVDQVTLITNDKSVEKHTYDFSFKVSATDSEPMKVKFSMYNCFNE